MRLRIVVWIGHWLCLLDSIVGIITFCSVNSSLWFRWVAYSARAVSFDCSSRNVRGG